MNAKSLPLDELLPLVRDARMKEDNEERRARLMEIENTILRARNDKREDDTELRIRALMMAIVKELSERMDKYGKGSAPHTALERCRQAIQTSMKINMREKP